MNIALFEDPLYKNFEPISLSHPVCMLLYGTSRIYEKWVKALKSKDYYFVCRKTLGELLSEELGLKNNVIPRGDNLFINSRYIPTPESIAALRKLQPGEAAFADDDLLAFRVTDGLQFSNDDILNLHDVDSYNKIKGQFKRIKVQAKPINYLWEMVDNNGEMIRAEFPEIKKALKTQGKVDSRATLIKKSAIAILSGANIGPQVTIDASDGPVIIDKGVVVEPLTYIKGPAYIGKNCRIVGGKIREGCSFGPVCRVGGEVEETIMLGYSNKYHEGFLGHAYIGEWVNLGAMTTNSDLKNNYTKIEVMVNDESTETGRIKVGCFIGDHTKTGIGTLLNTGISIGFSCNLYGGALFTDKAMKSFSWGTPGNIIEYRPDKAMQTAANSMARRDIKFGPLHERLFTEIHQKT
jgi:UDP-N-acetylglucosamine diphosphorylase / glucose-1-phosphate thymidylyltransferase / UDP-N-acetylgalactosamine diphosphorylase / glucosamine-1-phosphate N-acetyltransferase / galactosamine-1-phosphate N-acetyltransferase